MGDCTEHFNFSEFVVSDDFPAMARQMSLGEMDRYKIFIMCQTILEPVRLFLGTAIAITSGYRSQQLLDALKNAGYPVSMTSDHCFKNWSAACDFTTMKDKREDAFQFIRNRLPFAFGQVIGYRDSSGDLKHIHVSLPTEKHKGEVYESRDKIQGLTRLPAVIA